ncbi:MAG: alpha/beta hydrolase [Pseudomonadota bacterium]
MPFLENGTAYDVYGPADGHPVVLIHGLGLTRQSTWQAMIADFSERYRLVTYDLPGHGESALPSSDVTLTLMSEQLIALLDALHINQAALIGFSLGGMINRRCAMDHPERVTGLVMLNTPHERGEEQQRLVERRARDTSDGGPAATIDATLERWFTAAFRTQHPDVVERIRQVVLANNHTNYAAHRLVLAEGVKELIRPQPALTHPALVLTSENDTGSSRAMAEAIAAEITRCDTVVVPDLQHLGLIEKPELFSKPVLDFLDRTLP